ncbi:MAG: flagellar biosynthesis anti-sigma factor FlgM [Bradymonadales bacterium]|nr:flagellar biosynthesis anti-sigma factor FlgM [Bradymonadales bacterium]
MNDQEKSHDPKGPARAGCALQELGGGGAAVQGETGGHRTPRDRRLEALRDAVDSGEYRILVDQVAEAMVLRLAGTAKRSSQ